MINMLITLIIIAVLVGLLWWVCDYLPVPEPLNKILKFAGVVIAVIVIVVLLARLAGYDTRLGFIPPAMAQTTQKYTRATQPPPGHTCADFYRSRDYGSLFANLYENPQPSVTPQIYCAGQPGQPPAIAQPKEKRP